MRQSSDYSDRSDQELVEDYLAGGNLAAQALVVRYRRHLYSVASKFGLSDEDCGDVIQDVWLAFQEHVHELRERDKFAAWLTKILKNGCLAVVEKNKVNLPPGDEAEDAVDPGRSQEHIVVEAEKRQLVREAAERGPIRYRTLIKALFYDGLSYEEAGALLGISRDAVGRERSRCLDYLRLVLAKQGYTY